MALQVLAVVLGGGCSHPSEPPLPPEEPISHGILPLKVGYYWRYDEYPFNPDSTLGPRTGETGFRITQVTPASQGSESVLFFHWVSWDPATNVQSPLSALRTNFADGLYLMGALSPSDTFSTKLLDRRYPVAKGDTWFTPNMRYDPYQGKFLFRDSTLYTCVGTDAIFETPVGTFTCVIYHYIEDLQEEDVTMDWEFFEYFAYDVGRVGSIMYHLNPRNGMRYLARKTVLVETNVSLPRKVGVK